ncbi:uncharacterized protein NECHADRAFT_78174 [Fusarium vanettenii 77-13-4]|uniref:Cystathionine gamma-synthase n=1 Tax=Fusarium vanettenii (strain ATCC MYA-4622 / CBS 123669 / FGSC 9596 / NRRL 45880 / 77-13-4) TaxID=660122 RepID=C7YNB8_FUSV7|nr:uncharacterized protein NECHADRAFT_78174 [Fusarium vanettenii 77-13-4]EEU47097.1 hypothetical protein NECHADRAFT_78174 [Fusarium vanettenii 77-13-4]
MKAQLGSPLPPGDKHAVSVYLPTWKDTLAWAQRDPELLAQMKTGYPRFFVPLIVRELSERLLEWIASKIPADEATKELMSVLAEPGRSAMLFPACHLAGMGRKYLQLHTDRPVVVVQIAFDGSIRTPGAVPLEALEFSAGDICAVVHPQELVVEAKAFWQHAGCGISTRRATYWLEHAPFLNGGKRKVVNLLLKEPQDAKITLQRRIGDLLSTETNKLATDAVFLYPTGMSAISHTASTVRCLYGSSKETLEVAVFGFLYVDTFKVLSKVHGFDCKLYGHATLSDLEADLAAGMQLDALYTEFPGNPLLGSVDLDRLYQLANDYNFLFVVDDTVATSVNVDLISLCDLACTSLTKMFSGACNVMGGSIALNPQSKLFTNMKKVLDDLSIDTYFPLDVIVMEENSVDFEERVIVASRNAERIADTLRQHSSVDQVYYPKGDPTQDIYERFKRPGRGYGYLLSVRFKKPEAAIAFHDALDVAKGPSLGTNFTLCCTYALFTHYSELEWAAEFGVVEHLVRISVGIESQGELDALVATALAAAAKSMGSVMNGKL